MIFCNEKFSSFYPYSQCIVSIPYSGKFSWGPNFILCYLQLICVFNFRPFYTGKHIQNYNLHWHSTVHQQQCDIKLVAYKCTSDLPVCKMLVKFIALVFVWHGKTLQTMFNHYLNYKNMTKNYNSEQYLSQVLAFEKCVVCQGFSASCACRFKLKLAIKFVGILDIMFACGSSL